jgi:hypothetical protein
MAAGAEADQLGGITNVRPSLVVLALEAGEVDDEGLRGRLAG